jgi:hypothetical protein
VSVAHVEATLPFMPPMVHDMVTLQRLTGARPGEVCRVRPLDLDMSNLSCCGERAEAEQVTARGSEISQDAFPGCAAAEEWSPACPR